MIQDKSSIMQVLGCVIKQPNLLSQTEKYKIQNTDFPERFHMIIFAAINNLYQQGSTEINPMVIDSFLSKYDVQYKIFNDNDGINYLYNIEEMANLNNFDYSYNRLKKYSLLRTYKESGIDITEIYDEGLITPKEQEKMQEEFDKITIDDIINKIDKRVIVIKDQFKSNSELEGKQAGDGLEELIEELKINPEMGAPLCSNILNTICRGARLKKFYIRSAPSGGGKSRLALADALNLAVDEMYDLKQNKWVSNGRKEKVLYITTELDFSEIQVPCVAFVSGVTEDKILDGNLTEEESERVNKGIEIVGNSGLWLEHIPDFGIEDIERAIERNILTNGIEYVFFDYIHTSMKILAEITEKSKISLREDQVLLLLSDKLKSICNKHNIFLMSGTQLNGEWKTAGNQDSSAIRGSKAIIDKTDVAMITLPVTKEDLEKIQPILATGFYPQPNMVVNIFKNRRGRYNSVKVWLKVNLGNLRTEDLFMTSNNFELINIEKTKIIIDDSSTTKNSFDF